MNIFGSVNIVLQSIGRVYRIDQRHETQMYLMTLNEIYDQMLQTRTVNKMKTQISRQRRINVIDEQLAETTSEHSEGEKHGHPSKPPYRHSRGRAVPADDGEISERHADDVL